MKVCILDPGLQNQEGLPSKNLGDLIIQDSVTREVNRLFPNAEVFRYATHSPLTSKQLSSLSEMDTLLVGGTNLLSSRFRPYNRWSAEYESWSNQWSIHLLDALKIRRATLLGAGWITYQDDPGFFARLMFKTALNASGWHSVRDAYSREKLQKIGIQNVLNTGCVTMWRFAEMDMTQIPTRRAENALLMLTDYSRDYEQDKKLLNLLKGSYKEVYAWPQGTQDAAYLKELEYTGVVLERSLPALDAFIQSGADFDYIGTRLHGGIRCLQNLKRTLIIEVDNRAAEIAKDTHLPTVKRDDFAFLHRWLEGSPPPCIQLNMEAIEQWRGQFKRA